jgi:ribonucleoside-diphosphate reductase alpha chain
MEINRFKNSLAQNVFKFKYAQGPSDTWDALADRLVEDVCGTRWGTDRPLLSPGDCKQLAHYIKTFQFVPGGRYLYYAGRTAKFFNNCYLLRAEEDTREEWANVTWRAMSCLMTGGGIGIDYSRLRASGRPLARTGGLASGPIPLMCAVNEIGRNVMQGGSRRSAIYASLNWQHEDIPLFLGAKNWSPEVRELKSKDFNFPANLDMTNISVNYDDEALYGPYPYIKGSIIDGKTVYERTGNRLATNSVFLQNVRQAMETGEPGFSFNFGEKENETLRNACTEVTSEDDSDVCNLGSINLGNISSLEEFCSVVQLASKFLVCGTLRAELPYEKVYKVREKNRRLGLGLMGIHEWLLKRGQKYEVTPELHEWLKVYERESERAADEHCERLYISKPVAYRAIAPTGSIGILAGTTTGIEPLFAVAYKRRYLTEGTKWKYEFVVDSTADLLIREYGLKPENIDTAYKLSHDYEQRIKFQADIQDYVDMSISSTINLPSWGSKGNSEQDVERFAGVLSQYAPRLRGFTCYPDGSRGGQPITEVDYNEAIQHKGVIFQENDICEISGKGGTCGS